MRRYQSASPVKVSTAKPAASVPRSGTWRHTFQLSKSEGQEYNFPKSLNFQKSLSRGQACQKMASALSSVLFDTTKGGQVNQSFLGWTAR